MMLEPKPIFKPYQFVQQIEFKNKDIHRHDLGLDYFGFIKNNPAGDLQIPRVLSFDSKKTA